jgi:hypothetical protein
MDKKSVITKVLMVLGFVIGGIGGAATAASLPDDLKTIQGKKVKPLPDPVVETPAEE